MLVSYHDPQNVLDTRKHSYCCILQKENTVFHLYFSISLHYSRWGMVVHLFSQSLRQDLKP